MRKPLGERSVTEAEGTEVERPGDGVVGSRFRERQEVEEGRLSTVL